MRLITFFSTLVLFLVSSAFSHFNYCEEGSLAIVNEINSTSYDSDGKDNHLTQSAKLDYRLRTVVIDPGHGGHDHGCSGHHSKEKHVALSISKKLGKYIKDKYPKVKVVYTRTKDVFVPLHARAKMANENKADLFISIHCNAVSKMKHLARGTETYVMGLHDAEENLDVAKRENEAILLEKNYEKNYDGFDPESPEGHIILAMVQNAFLEQSIAFAYKVEENFKKIAGRKSRGVKQAGFLVLRETTMPSVLIESGYLTNKNEEKFMASDKGQDDLAFAIFKAFQSYKTEIELENSTLPPPLPANNPKFFPIKMDDEKNSEKKEIKINKSRDQKRTAKNKIVYKVQLVATSKKLKTDSDIWTEVNFPLEIKREKGKFKYLAGNFENLKAARIAQEKLQRAGFDDAFVVAYRGKKRVKVN
ncbi:MAG: N-acetylmuramoyl-L-alanine amidase [Bacteroidota bacterium]